MTEASANQPKDVLSETPKPASAWVVAQHQALLTALPFADTADFDDAARGFLGTIDHAKVTSAHGSWWLEEAFRGH